MLQLSVNSRILVAVQPIDFRNGIEGIGGICRCYLNENPMSGVIFVFRNRAKNAIKVLCYDGQGFWLCMKRLSTGRLTWWPTEQSSVCHLSARELQVLLWNGNPTVAQLSPDWQQVA